MDINWKELMSFTISWFIIQKVLNSIWIDDRIRKNNGNTENKLKMWKQIIQIN